MTYSVQGVIINNTGLLGVIQKAYHYIPSDVREESVILPLYI